MKKQLALGALVVAILILIIVILMGTGRRDDSLIPTGSQAPQTTMPAEESSQKKSPEQDLEALPDNPKAAVDQELQAVDSELQALDKDLASDQTDSELGL